MNLPAKIRLDQLLVQKGLFSSREKASKTILAGWVRVNGELASKPGHKISEDAVIEIKQRSPFVSRGGEKLIHAFQQFNISCQGKICADLGASTGGFTDCLLKKGAKKVYAVDVGYGQLEYQLRQNPNVVNMEKTNARYLTKNDFPETIEFLTADLSFISLKKVIPAIHSILDNSGTAILLIKPQFEAQKKEVQKGGVIKKIEVKERIIKEIREALAQAEFEVKNVIPSPIKGPAGNEEFLIWIEKR